MERRFKSDLCGFRSLNAIFFCSNNVAVAFYLVGIRKSMPTVLLHHSACTMKLILVIPRWLSCCMSTWRSGCPHWCWSWFRQRRQHWKCSVKVTIGTIIMTIGHKREVRRPANLEILEFLCVKRAAIQSSATDESKSFTAQTQGPGTKSTERHSMCTRGSRSAFPMTLINIGLSLNLLGVR